MKKPTAPLVTRLLNRVGLYRKVQVREAMANFQAAAINRLTASWTQTTLSADAQARTDLKTLRNRSRELRDNNLYAKRFLSTLKKNVLGQSGMHFRNKAKDPDKFQGGDLIPGKLDLFANKLIADQWWRWGRKENCTVTGKLSFCDVERLILETVAVDGEVLIRKIRRPENPFGFALQILESDYIDDDYDTVNPANGNEVRMGVELDKWEKPVAYHLLTYNPNDSYGQRRAEKRRYRLPAEEVMHLALFRRFGQSRGNPWLATAAYALNMLGKYEEAEVTAARASASKMGFLIPNNANTSYTGETDADGNHSMDAEPGAIEQLPFGMDLKVLDWNHPNSSYHVFMKTGLRAIASGLDMSYNTLANDMESVNFASGKLGLDDERDAAKAIQYWMIENFHEEIFKEFLLMSITTGAVALPMGKFDKFNSPEFKGRRWSYVNPQQEVNADISQLRNCLTSHSRILAERNIDRDELFDEIEDDKRAADSRGITLSEVEHTLEAEARLTPAAPEPQQPE